jgi:3D (Asp-Asp-Asp) domain-containing protein
VASAFIKARITRKFPARKWLSARSRAGAVARPRTVLAGHAERVLVLTPRGWLGRMTKKSQSGAVLLIMFSKLVRILTLAALSLGVVSCGGTKPATASRAGQQISNVKTTAYTHTESDHKKYKNASAVGSSLKYGDVRSAAADWSVYPVGTIFKIQGDSHLYEVDDYGSALVGTNTIDLYKPTKGEMKGWGARHVNIEVVKWGSFSRSLAIMRDRQKASSRVRAMVQRIENNNS